MGPTRAFAERPRGTARAEPIHDCVRGRIRLRIGAIYRDPALARSVEAASSRGEGVRSVAASARTASLLVLFDPRALTADRVRSDVEAVVRGLLEGTLEPPPAGPGGRAARARVPDLLRARARHHAEPLDALLAQVEARLDGGLSTPEAAARLARDGPNALPPARRRSELAIFLRQLESLPVALLGGAAVLSAATGALADAVIILCVVGANATIGYVTESQAERTLRALVTAEPTRARVVRDRATVEVPLFEVVVGDLLALSPSIFVPADARLVASDGLTVDESTLTGESVPAEKEPIDALAPELPLADRRNMVFRGTTVQGGSGLAVVVATGASTEIGGIELLSRSVERPATPLEKQLDRLGAELILTAGAVCGCVFGIGLLRGRPFLEILRTSVSLAVAAVPEGLPTVAVTTLALGVRRMKRRHFAVRRLSAVETLGAVQVLCVDKTGTLTRNRMAAVAIRTASLEEDGPSGAQRAPSAEAAKELETLHRIAVLASDADLVEGDRWVGSPTEVAILRAARAAGVDVRALRASHPRTGVRYRTATRSFVETSHRLASGARLLAVKGRPADVLRLCGASRVGDEARPLDGEARERWLLANERLAGRALRVLGVAYREDDGSGGPPEAARDLVFVGLVGLMDPPREGLTELFAAFHRAGIETVMLTGDQSATAQAIGRQIGVARNGRVETLDASELERIDKAILAELVRRVQVFSRVSPAHKLEIVRALQSASRVVAMTGDGVNDSPALEAADVGIALGRTGSSAAREAAAVVLERDDLRTIFEAIEQGRAIYDDIRKAVHFIIATNSSELLVMLATVALGIGEALSPMQLLYVNLLTDVFPELALAVEPPEADVMSLPPRDPREPMFGGRDRLRVGAEGAVLTGTALGAFAYGLGRHGPGAHAGTVAFSALTGAQLLHALSARSDRHSIFDPGHVARNPFLAPTVGLGIGLQVLATTMPGLRTLLGTTRLDVADAIVASGASLASFVLNEALKVAMRKRPEGRAPEPAEEARGGAP